MGPVGAEKVIKYCKNKKSLQVQAHTSNWNDSVIDVVVLTFGKQIFNSFKIRIILLK